MYQSFIFQIKVFRIICVNVIKVYSSHVEFVVKYMVALFNSI